jgi:hypothetical protein
MNKLFEKALMYLDKCHQIYSVMYKNNKRCDEMKKLKILIEGVQKYLKASSCKGHTNCGEYE